MLRLDTQMPTMVHFFKVPFTGAEAIYGRVFGFES